MKYSRVSSLSHSITMFSGSPLILGEPLIFGRWLTIISASPAIFPSPDWYGASSVDGTILALLPEEQAAYGVLRIIQDENHGTTSILSLRAVTYA
jgi:hypothetical protein